LVGKWTQLLAGDQPQLRPVPPRLEDRHPPLLRQFLEAVGLEQRLVELASLTVGHVHERRVADHLLGLGPVQALEASSRSAAHRLDGARSRLEAAGVLWF
jgi:hypothetical protein